MAGKGKKKAGRDRANDKATRAYERQRDEVTRALIERMKEGPEWVCEFAGKMPTSGATGKQYGGKNWFLLSEIAISRGYDDNRWFTAAHAARQGWEIRDGAKPAFIAKWKRLGWNERAIDEDGNVSWERHSWMGIVGGWRVYNADEIEGVPPAPKTGSDDCPEVDEVCDRLIGSSRCEVREDDAAAGAFYSPGEDYIHVPTRKSFTTREGFLRTLAHEMGHSTGPECGRDAVNRFGSKGYAFEELVAELSAAYVAGDLGFPITDRDQDGREFADNHAAYLRSWLGALREDPDYLYKAAGKAAQAARLIVDRYRADDGADGKDDGADGKAA